jgi:hypothetical protein
MKRSREPTVPRRPLQFVRLKDTKVGSLTLDVKVRRTGGSIIVVFNYVDTLHFYYIHRTGPGMMCELCVISAQVLSKSS